MYLFSIQVASDKKMPLPSSEEKKISLASPRQAIAIMIIPLGITWLLLWNVFRNAVGMSMSPTLSYLRVSAVDVQP